ncbi:hypothetical protein [uncultured Olegusella sp.]|uniref:hypothetical protein n=1 Tax=uncultured Olegusella sp. TaxID=1979846 RepID=UPI00263285E7|nr:hypothetical protein [uncultured Olegusella sp.]
MRIGLAFGSKAKKVPMGIGMHSGDISSNKSAKQNASVHASSSTSCSPLSIFISDEGGYTTVAMAVALLVSLVLVFGAASVAWSTSRASEVQEVADATALAGANAVSAFTTVAQVSDAIVLSMGLAGLATMGTGLMLSALPITHAAAIETINVGRSILDLRRNFAKSAATGLQKLEKALPALVMANAASCTSANSTQQLKYVGSAIPFPLTSETDYSFLDDGLSGKELEDNAKKLQDASERKKDAMERADAAKEKAWRADCVDNPHCMRSRAQTLAGLSGAYNPNYASFKEWRFDYARIRSLNYYRTRTTSEHPHGSSAEELTRSAARKQFYSFAAREMEKAKCIDKPDYVEIQLPELPHTAAMVRATSLYTDSIWPCTDEEEGHTLHSSLACPGATGAYAGTASLGDIDSGTLRCCPKCGMNVQAQASAASASTNINNGYEHYWRIVVDASRDYLGARNDEIAAEKELEGISEESDDLFQKAMDILAVERPDFVPAGAWGCVAVVMRDAGSVTPAELTGAFSPGAKLPAGAAISAATLAPEDSSGGSTVLSQVLAGIESQAGFGVAGIAQSALALWGKLLVDYGSAFETAQSYIDGFLDDAGWLMGEQVAQSIKKMISSTVKSAGFEPADMRARKPVLVHSQEVLDKAGDGREQLSIVREIVQKLPHSGDAAAQVLAREVASQLGGPIFTVAEIEIPGTGVKIPLTIDISKYLGGG